MSTVLCDRAVLVEAMFDGRLGPAELASTERHVKSCTSCAELLRDLTTLREMLRSSSSAISPLVHQRARLALLRQNAAPSAAKRRPVALLIAALVTLPLAVWASTSSVSPLRIWYAAPALSTETAPSPSAVGRKHAPSEAMPTASSTATDDPIALLPSASALSETSAPAIFPPPSTPLRAHPDLRDHRDFSRAPAPKHPRRALVESGEKLAAAAPSAEVSQASQDFAEAMNALSRGDFIASARKLENFVAVNPRDARVEDAIYLEAIAFERAGRLEGAKAAARRYLAAYPDGAHRVQARRITGD